MLGGPLVALQEGDDVSAPAGNRDRFSAPHGLYPTRGSDEWVAIACPDDDAWRRLRQLLGDPEWARSTTLDTLAGRLASASSLDERIACWTRSRDRWEIAELLQSRSIPAAPVLTSGERLVDEHLTSRDVLAVVEHPVVGSELIYGVPWKLRRTPGRVRSAAPLLGADTEAVLEEIGAIPRAGSPVAEAEWRRTG
jgi:crotonobetainyl-CoA:carnitine CoA-transferase CaiB-like acyl-CoA transferase